MMFSDGYIYQYLGKMFSDGYIYRYIGNHVQRWIFTDILVRCSVMDIFTNILVMMFNDGYIYQYLSNDVQ